MTQRSLNILDKIGSLIPGYDGYKDRSSRKNCDKQLRVILSNKLNEYENSITTKIDISMKNSNINDMNKYESFRKKINTLSSKILYSPYGSNAFFSDQKINEDELDTIYQYDLDLSDKVEKLAALSDFSDLEITNSISDISIALVNRNNYINSFK